MRIEEAKGGKPIKNISIDTRDRNRWQPEPCVSSRTTIHAENPPGLIGIKREDGTREVFAPSSTEFSRY